MAMIDAEVAHVPTEATRSASGPAWIGWFMAIAAIAAFSTATPVAKGALMGGMDPNALLMGRMAIATALMGVTIAVSNPRRLFLPKRGVLLALASGGFNAIGMILYFMGLTYIESSMAAMIISLSPLMVLSLLALRGEKVTYRHAVRMALALAGVYLLIGPSGDVSITGALLIVVSILAFSLQMAFMQWYLKDYDARAVVFYVLVAMSAGVFIWWVAKGMVWTPPGAAGWTAILTLAIVGTYAARLLVFWSVSLIGGGQTSMLTPLETLLAVIWSYMFLGERLAPVQLIGGLLIVFSAVLAIQRLQRGKRRSRWRVWART